MTEQARQGLQVRRTTGAPAQLELIKRCNRAVHGSALSAALPGAAHVPLDAGGSWADPQGGSLRWRQQRNSQARTSSLRFRMHRHTIQASQRGAVRQMFRTSGRWPLQPQPGQFRWGRHGAILDVGELLRRPPPARRRRRHGGPRPWQAVPGTPTNKKGVAVRARCHTATPSLSF